jgi:hypothetical protein
MAIMKVSLEKMEANQENVETKMEARKNWRLQICRQTPEVVEVVVEHQKVAKQEAAVENMGALEDRCGDQSLAVRRCGLPRNVTKATMGPGRS